MKNKCTCYYINKEVFTMNNQANKGRNHNHNHSNTDNSGIAINDSTTMNHLDNYSKIEILQIQYMMMILPKDIGITFASDKHLNTIDSFWFALKPGIFVRPFDFVTIEYLRPRY